MSKIENMISQICPNGVKFRELQEIFEIRHGFTPSNLNKKIGKGEATPFFRVEDIRKNGTILNDSTQHISKNSLKRRGLFPANSIIIGTTAITGVHALITVPHLANEQFKSLSLKPEFTNQLDMRYVYYYCFVLDKWCLANATASIFSYVKMEGFKRFKFAIPPLPIQQEIVKFLDYFTKLGEELNAELVARRQQYSYYLDYLISGNRTKDREENKNMVWQKLGEVGKFIRGNGLQKKDFTDSGVGCIHYGQIHTHYGTYAHETKSYTSTSLAKKLRKAQKGDLVIATTSEDDNDVCKSVVWLGDEEVVVSSDAYIYQHSLNPKYVAYFFKSKLFQNQKRRYITGAKVKRVSGESMSKIQIPVPSIEKQEQIVAILDNFDSLVNNTSFGLPAEISARQKQSEYYRNQLLTFREDI